MQPIIKWSGSKRSQTKQILNYFPTKVRTYYEPFVVGGSLLYSVLERDLCDKAIVGDICKPLVDLWLIIKDYPEEIIVYYTNYWLSLQKEGERVYYACRDRFNNDFNPKDFFCLNRTCFNGLVRFNSEGKFNVSYHLTRKGIDPSKIESIIKDWTFTLRDKVTFLNLDYSETIKNATEEDMVYFDPPYVNTKGMYSEEFDHTRFYSTLEKLNRKNIRWLLSYDGDRYLYSELPRELYKSKYLLESGNSSFSRLKKKQVKIKESLYVNF